MLVLPRLRHPGFGTPAATLDSNGEPIPEFGRASNKWCLQPVDNLSHPAQVSVTKSVEPATATGWAFHFTIHPAPPAGAATLTATPAHPTVTWLGLDPDVTYTITEGAASGYSPGKISCPDGGNSVQPPPGGTAKCVVTNTADPAELRVTKTVRGANAPADWAFDFTIHPAPTEGPATARATAGAPTVTFTGLDAGRTYTVTEAAVEGFEQVELNCGKGGPTVTPGPGEVLSCTAVNAFTCTPPPPGTPGPTEPVTPTATPTPPCPTATPTPTPTSPCSTSTPIPTATPTPPSPTTTPIPTYAPTLASTGVAYSILPLVAAGVAALVIGAALIALARRSGHA